MTEATLAPDGVTAKKSKFPLLIGLLLALLGGGGGFYAAWSGMLKIPFLQDGTAASDKVQVAALPDIAFVALDPVLVPMGPAGERRHLRFGAQLEVPKAYSADTELLKPRIMDVLNSYLGAVSLAELEDPGAMTRMRAQMLRRVQIVTGEGRVRDLLVTEFVMN